MSESSETGAVASASESLPWCHFCDKPVESVKVVPDPDRAEMVIVEYHCHNESAQQMMPSLILKQKDGLAGYTAFNDYTSGLLPRH
jgi:hypothetical protein